MRSYQKKFMRTALRQQIAGRIETRDAIVFTIDETNNICGVKIQGSDEIVYAHFPRNITSRPKWVKLGNAVRVTHRSGVGGYVEINGPGRAIPTAVPGGTVMPVFGAVTDQIISGLTVHASDPAQMAVYVMAGYFRIDNVTYAFDPSGTSTDIATMGDTPSYIMGAYVGTGILTMGIGGIGGTERVNIDAAPSAGTFRYDTIAIGVDGVLDYVKGSNFTSTVSYPNIPNDHLQVGPYILIVGGVTGVTDAHIGQQWTAPSMAYLSINPDNEVQDEFEWSEISDTPVKTITLSFKDQYNLNFVDDHYAVVEWLVGTGGMSKSFGGPFEHTDLQFDFHGSSFNFYLQRDQLLGSAELSPIFHIKVWSTEGLETIHTVVLLDEFGDRVDGG